MEILVERREIVEELSKRYNKKEKVIQIMIDKCIEMNYNIERVEELVDGFYK